MLFFYKTILSTFETIEEVEYDARIISLTYCLILILLDSSRSAVLSAHLCCSSCARNQQPHVILTQTGLQQGIRLPSRGLFYATL